MTGIRVEHLGPNRSGKTLMNAIFAWEAYNRGRDVYCTCPEDDQGRFDCILNFAHEHFDVSRPMEQDIYNCYLMTDESVEFLDARGSMKKTTKDFGYFGYQVLKRDIEWHYDTVLHENSGVLATSTLALSSMLQSTIVLVDVFFLFMALVSLFDFYGRNWHGGK